MAGNIQKVSLQTLSTEIRDYYNLVCKLDVYGVTLAIKRLTKYWTGKRINMLINEYNQMSTNLYDGVVYFEETILGVLGEIYEQYLAMEKGQPYDVVKEKISTLPQMSAAQGIKVKIPTTDESTIKYEAANVEKEVRVIRDAIEKTKATLKSLTNKLDSMATYSDSLKTLVTTYQSKSKVLSTNLSSMEEKLLTQVNKAVNDVKVTEQYNEKDARRASNTSAK